MAKVLQLWKEANKHGELIIAGLVDVPKRLKEERVYLEQEPGGSS